MLVWSVLGAFAVWAFLACLDLGGQRKLFFEGGAYALSDFWMPRTCLEQGYSHSDNVAVSRWEEGVFKVADHDRCYPALALMPLKLFPATSRGAWCWAAVCAAVYLAALLGIAPVRRRAEVAALFLSMPVLFAAERGNAVLLSAACVAVFLAWHDEPHPARRWAAALAVSLAACLKISPVLLGVLYLGGGTRSTDVKSLSRCVVFCAVLFFAPFLFTVEGFRGLGAFVVHAAQNAQEGQWRADFGLIPLWRAARLACGFPAGAPWSGVVPAVRLTQAAGLGLLALAARRHDRLLAVAGLLLAAGNMYYYGLVYVLPVYLLDDEPRGGWNALLWFVMLAPLQLVVAGHAANALLANVALFALVARRVASPGTRQNMV